MHLQMLTCLQDLQVRNIWLLTPLLPLQVHASSRLHCHIQLEIVQYLRFLHSVQLQLVTLHHLYFSLSSPCIYQEPSLCWDPRGEIYQHRQRHTWPLPSWNSQSRKVSNNCHWKWSQEKGDECEPWLRSRADFICIKRCRRRCKAPCMCQDMQ